MYCHKYKKEELRRIEISMLLIIVMCMSREFSFSEVIAFMMYVPEATPLAFTLTPTKRKITSTPTYHAFGDMLFIATEMKGAQDGHT
jgi:hypothetical protein